MFRLLALLQLTRAALAFTAIADAWTVLLLRIQDPTKPEPGMFATIGKMLVLSVVSAGLYGFGMALNDLLDARRDRIFAKWRPIPSGRIHPRTAIIIALLLLMMSLFAAATLGGINALVDQRIYDFIPFPFLFAFATAGLIVLYDGTSKYLGALGILTLGAVRALHCLIGKPGTELLFLSMFLLNHVFIVTLIAYRLENKRPRLRTWDVFLSFAGLILGNGAAILYMWLRNTFSHQNWVHNRAWMMLVGPAVAAVIFTIWASTLLSRTNLSPRQKGERLMLLGLFWLFVYDASMLFSNRQFLAGISVVLLFICALMTFFGIRTLNRFLARPKVQYRIAPAPDVPPSSIREARS